VAVTAAGGGVGVHMVQVARVCGADAAGLEVVPEKLRFLEEELSVVAVDSSDFGSVALPGAWHGRADVIVDLVGTRASLSWAVGALAPNGRLVVLTTFRGVDFEVSPRELVFRQARIIGSRYASRAELGTAGRMAASGRVRPVVTRVVDAGCVDGVHDQLRRGELIGRGALAWGA
jgi:propanol-preferring alcohol dehydrogenase